VQEQNPHCGVFYFTMAARLADRKKFIEAEPLFKQAIQRMPQLTQARGELGLMYMRLGEEVAAEKLLTESFEIDPFNVRVSNMLKVLEVLSGYAVLETDHFVIRFDRGRDEILARYAAAYLEEVYPQLCRQFGFEPQGKSLFEIFSRARNTNGHGWFSARMVGLPYIGTVGACAGKMVALASPNDMDQKYNWARVLKHEFIHVLNLQQTNFNIPHWYTEALAVLNEGYPRSEVWNQLLAARVPKGEIFNLDDINLGFIRPKSSLDWQMAYCQAELYAEYMLDTYGEDALAKMLAAYRDNLSTRQALERSFGVTQEDFERGYVAHLKRTVAQLSPGKEADEEMTLAQLVRAQAADPENPDLAAKLAYAHLQRKAYPDARQLAKAALKQKPKHQLASYVLARIHLLVGDTQEALDVLENAVDPDDPEENVINLLAALRLRDKQYNEAAKLYQLASRKDPGNSRWIKALARVYLESGDKRRLGVSLEQLVQMDADELVFRKKLAQMALEVMDYKSAARWAREALQIDVQDAELHGMLARALRNTNQLEEALREFQTSIQLDPKNSDLRLALARAHLEAQQPDKARAVLQELLKLNADHEEARQLLESLPQ
jgi:tetratricopeptide (TPR) repeat protein